MESSVDHRRAVAISALRNLLSASGVTDILTVSNNNLSVAWEIEIHEAICRGATAASSVGSGINEREELLGAV